MPGELFRWLGLPLDALHDHLTDAAPDVRNDAVHLSPYAAAWLTAAP